MGGFTLPEMMIALTLAGIIAGSSFTGIRRYMNYQKAHRAERQLEWELTTARSYAIRTGRPVTIAVNEGTMTMTVRDSAGTVLRQTSFGSGSASGAKKVELTAPGDTVIFSQRGLCLNCRGTAPEFRIDAGGMTASFQLGFSGRAERMVTK